MGTALATAAFAVDAGGAIAGHAAQNKASAANKNEAKKAYLTNVRDLTLREDQESQANTMTILEADREMRRTQALARVSAGESNLAGVSVDAIMGDLDRQGAEFRDRSNQNLDMTLSQIERDKAAARATMTSRVNSVPTANPFATALRIGSAGLSFGERVYTNKNPKPKGG